MLVPNLRFPKYKSYWTNYSLKDVSSNVSYGMNSAAKKYDGYNKYIRITDIDEITREFTPNPISSPSGYLDNKYKLKSGDILFTRTGASVGKTYLYKKRDGNLYFAGFLIRFSICKANPYFVYSQTLTTRYKRWVNIYSMRSGQPGINAEEYKDFNFYAPCIEEQNKIADFLSSVDEKIALQNRKVELLQQYKKGMMQKLFSQKIRFKNDSGDFYSSWETTALGKMANFYKGKGISKQDITSKGENECIRYGELYTHYNEKINHILSKTNLSSSESLISHYGDILIPSSGETAEDISKASTVLINGVLLGGDLNIIRLKNDYNSLLLAYYLTHYKKKEISKLAQGNSVVHLYAKELKSLEITLPSSLDEQVKIANFFSSIDDKITLENTKLDKLKQWKQGLLQQMFV